MGMLNKPIFISNRYKCNRQAAPRKIKTEYALEESSSFYKEKWHDLGY